MEFESSISCSEMPGATTQELLVSNYKILMLVIALECVLSPKEAVLV